MRLRITALTAWLAAMMPTLPAQDQPAGPAIDVFTVDVGQPVRHLALCDLTGDGRNDLLLVTGTRPPLCVVARRRRAEPGFEEPEATTIPEGVSGLVVVTGPTGTTLVTVPHEAATASRPPPATLGSFGPLPQGALPDGPAPEFLGFAQDIDGDGLGDPLTSDDDGFRLVLSRASRSILLVPPTARERSAGVRGLVSERARKPLLSIEALAPSLPRRPLFFASDRLLALTGSFESGFGPEAEVILTVPSSTPGASLERTEARLVDVEGDGSLELLVVRTRTEGAALANVRTELLFHRILGAEPGRPVQAILLPGILSSGPDLKDVDGDGRLDLFLSVFGENLTHQLARRLTGRVRLDYLLYRGSTSGPPFQRTPDFSESDSVPEAQFMDWGLRHRWILDDDWSGDRVPDLIRMTVGAVATKLEVLPGGPRPGRERFGGAPVATAEAPVAVRDHRAWRLSASEPAILCRTARGAVIFVRR